MSYQLVFWKQQSGTSPDPQAVYGQVMEGQSVAGLDESAGDRFLTRIAEHFTAGWVRLDAHNWECAAGSFQVEIGPQHILVVSYSLPGEVLNQFLDIAAEFGCRLYDPQTGVRFDG